MKFAGFASETIKSTWAWVGLFMDIIGVIIYISPQMSDKLSFVSVVQQYWWIWIIAGTLLMLWGAWRVTDKVLKERERTLLTAGTNQHFGSGNIISGDKFSGDKVYGNKYEDIKVVLPDSKKKETLNKLDWHVKQVVNEIILYKTYSDKEILVKKKYNEFQDFYQHNSAEVSLVLEKLIEEISLEARNVISQIVIFHGMAWVRNTEIEAKVPSESLSPLPKREGIEEGLINLRDRIHEEIYEELKT